MKKMNSLFALAFAVFFLLSHSLLAQEPSKTELESILGSFKNYRFGSVSLYQIQNLTEFKRAIEQEEQSMSEVEVDDSILDTVPDELANIVENNVKQGFDLSAVTSAILKRGMSPPDPKILEKIYNYFEAKEMTTGPRIDKIFLVSTRAPVGKTPDAVIAMLVSKNPSSNLVKNLKRVGKSDIYVYDELKEFKLDSSYSASNMYSLAMNALVQQNYENKTLEMQGIGNPNWFAPSVYGKTSSLSSNQSNLSSYDIQKYLRISDGQPQLMGLKQNEVILSPDLISWKHYNKPAYWDGEKMAVDSTGNSNYNLPNLGIEVKYGLDEIGYPSFWSERMTAYALWKSGKLGLILPTSGWSNLSNDLFDIDRNLTHGGVGLAGEFDFPIKLIPKSGVFHASFGYVFGNAEETSYKDRPETVADFDNVVMSNYDDYLIRYNTQIHYTFGVAIDQDYMFRFGVGGTVYGVEKWNNSVDSSESGEKLIYSQYDEETIGGMSAKVEFMATYVTTPYGMTVQYFDERLFGNIWLQIPIVENTLALRLDAKAFAPLFEDEEHGWETGGYFIPMARFIVNF